MTHTELLKQTVYEAALTVLETKWPMPTTVILATKIAEAVIRQATSHGSIEDIIWKRVNDEPFEYAIQQDQFGDAFVKLLNGKCLRRPIK